MKILSKILLISFIIIGSTLAIIGILIPNKIMHAIGLAIYFLSLGVVSIINVFKKTNK